jgi:hypothetical protein
MQLSGLDVKKLLYMWASGDQLIGLGYFPFPSSQLSTLNAQLSILNFPRFSVLSLHME